MLHNIYIVQHSKEVLQKWNRSVEYMDLQVEEETLFTLQFADDQVGITSDKEHWAYI